MSMIETERLILLQYSERDRAAYRALMTDPVVMADRGGPLTLGEADVVRIVTPVASRPL